MAKRPNRSPQIEVTFDRTEGDYGILRLDDGQELLWPIKNLPKGAKEGDVLILHLLTAEELTASRQELAKKILEEIISGE